MMANSSGSGRTRLLGVVLLVATFLAGGMSGAAVVRRAGVAASARAVPAEVKSQAAESLPDHQHERKSRLIDQVDLSAELCAAIDSILHDGRERIDAYWKETEPGYRALVDSTRARVRAVMTQPQLEEYDRLRAERRARARSEDQGEGGNGSAGKSISKKDGRESSRINPGWRLEPKESRTE
jgi:uncharacterized membrane protein